jgi:hypothetical protein
VSSPRTLIGIGSEACKEVLRLPGNRRDQVHGGIRLVSNLRCISETSASRSSAALAPRPSAVHRDHSTEFLDVLIALTDADLES